MGFLADIAGALQQSRIATIVNQSSLMLGGLSGIHLIGFTLLLGAALVSNLRLVGMLFPDRPVSEIIRPAARAIAVGLTISIVSGLLLFMPRATTAIENWIFQLKMALIAVAVLFHIVVVRAVGGRDPMASTLQRVAGIVGIGLWIGLALTACAFLLIE